MSCPTIEHIVMYLEKQLATEQMDEMEQHLASCEACRQTVKELREITAVIAEDTAEPVDESFVDEVMAKLEPAPVVTQRRSKKRSTPKGLMLWVAAALPLAAAFLLYLYNPVMQQKTADEQFASRGQSSGDVYAHDAIKPFIVQGKKLSPVVNEIRRDDYLAFAYSHHKNEKSADFLMIFGVDEKAHVFWYFPAHEKSGQTPCSVAIGATDGFKGFDDSIQHALEPGNLHIYGIFSQKPLCVEQIEALFAVKGNEKASVGPGMDPGLPDTKAHILKLKVLP